MGLILMTKIFFFTHKEIIFLNDLKVPQKFFKTPEMLSLAQFAHFANKTRFWLEYILSISEKMFQKTRKA